MKKKSIVQDIDDQIDLLYARKARIQDKCSHPEHERTPHGDGGNIMTGRDASYWYECYCSLCDKRWNEPQ
jgi:hypothetical protein